MNDTEKKVLQNVLRRLRCAESPRHSAAFKTPSYGESEVVRLGLTGSIDPANILDDAEKNRLSMKVGQLEASRVGRRVNSYLESWVIGALESLLSEEDGGTGRDLKLALNLSR